MKFICFVNYIYLETKYYSNACHKLFTRQCHDVTWHLKKYFCAREDYMEFYISFCRRQTFIPEKFSEKRPNFDILWFASLFSKI